MKVGNVTWWEPYGQRGNQCITGSGAPCFGRPYEDWDQERTAPLLMRVQGSQPAASTMHFNQYRYAGGVHVRITDSRGAERMVNAFHFARDIRINGQHFTFDQAFGFVNRCVMYPLMRHSNRERSTTHINFIFNTLMHVSYTRDKYAWALKPFRLRSSEAIENFSTEGRMHAEDASYLTWIDTLTLFESTKGLRLLQHLPLAASVL